MKMSLYEYIWLDSNDSFCFRSKTRVLQGVYKLSDIPEWNYDGSSTGQAVCGQDTEVILKPVAMFNDPFRRDGDKLVWCQAHSKQNIYPESRVTAIESFRKNTANEPWFGIEQEYYITSIDNVGKPRPCGFHSIDYASPQTNCPYYCKMGRVEGRNIAEEHLLKCMFAGIKMSGMNAEVGPGQWEYQVGPCTGIDAGDHLMISRYILERIAENDFLIINWTPKPFQGDWNGSGCHTNFSTKEMREGTAETTGMSYIMKSISALEKSHSSVMKSTVFGIGNNERLTGDHETASANVFTHGEGTRHTSIRIGNETVREQKGYFEDRRPGSNMDPYSAITILNDSTIN